MIIDVNLLFNCVFMQRTALIFTHQLGVSLQLLIGRSSCNVRENGDIDIHVSSEHQCPRSISLQRNVTETMHNTSSNDTCKIESSFQLSFGSDCSAMQYCAENLTDNVMGRFNNGVGHRSVRRNFSFLNSPIHEHEFHSLSLNSGPLSITTFSTKPAKYS